MSDKLHALLARLQAFQRDLILVAAEIDAKPAAAEPVQPEGPDVIAVGRGDGG